MRLLTCAQSKSNFSISGWRAALLAAWNFTMPAISMREWVPKCINFLTFFFSPTNWKLFFNSRTRKFFLPQQLWGARRVRVEMSEVEAAEKRLRSWLRKWVEPYCLAAKLVAVGWGIVVVECDKLFRTKTRELHWSRVNRCDCDANLILILYMLTLSLRVDRVEKGHHL